MTKVLTDCAIVSVGIWLEFGAPKRRKCLPNAGEVTRNEGQLDGCDKNGTVRDFSLGNP